jgi:NAD-dependent dihydropyrimidine dehydrogenase PreA subunit
LKELLYLKDVVTLRLDPARCTGCGICLDVCPRAVLARSNGKVRITTLDACIECGACQQNCPAGALSVRAGVGCAYAIINAALGRTSADCCCTVEPREPDDPASSVPSDRTNCC